MARLPRPPREYSDLAMARELNAAIDAASSGGQVRTSADNSGQVRTRPADRDYRRTLFESLFQ